MRSLLLSSFLFAGILLVQTVTDGADKKPVAEVTVDNWGEPKELTKGKTLYWIWYDNGVWYVRTTGGCKENRRFQGVVTVTDGKLSDLKGVGGEKKGPAADVFVFNKTRTALEFDFRTGTQWDGLNFAVDDKATVLKFELLLDGKPQAANVKIGRNGDQPAEATFTTPARPVSKSTTDDKGKKGKKK